MWRIILSLRYNHGVLIVVELDHKLTWSCLLLQLCFFCGYRKAAWKSLLSLTISSVMIRVVRPTLSIAPMLPLRMVSAQ